MNRIFAMVAAVMVAGWMLPAQAQQQPRAQTDRDQPTASQLIAEDEAQVSRLKADLRLTKEQEADWGKLEDAFRAIAKERADRFLKWRDDQANRKEPPKLTEGLRLRAEALQEYAAQLKRIADAADPLYGRLDGTQQRRIAQGIQEFAMWNPIGEGPRRNSRRRNY
jgi:hypothetical protein